MQTITVLYTGEDGASHFIDLEMPMHRDKGVKGWLSTALESCSKLVFRHSCAEYERDNHNTADGVAMLLIPVSGTLRIVLPTNERREVKPGFPMITLDHKPEQVFPEVTPGHASSVIHAQDFTVFVAYLDPTEVREWLGGKIPA